MAPMIIPRTATHTLLKSMAGIIRLKNVAASIMPAENPSMMSNSLSETFLVNNTGSAPAPVARPAIELAAMPSQIISALISVTYSLHVVCEGISSKKRRGDCRGKCSLKEFGDEG